MPSERPSPARGQRELVVVVIGIVVRVAVRTVAIVTVVVAVVTAADTVTVAVAVGSSARSASVLRSSRHSSNRKTAVASGAPWQGGGRNTL